MMKLINKIRDDIEYNFENYKINILLFYEIIYLEFYLIIKISKNIYMVLL